MRAVVYEHYGEHDVLTVSERPVPQVGRGQILIRVLGAGVNPIDARLRSGEMKWMLPGGFPRIPGYDAAGIVEEVGAGSKFKPGERVVAFLDHLYGGGYAEFAVCSDDAAARIPDSMSPLEAAALPLAGTTALQSLRDHGRLKLGDHVLILGAAGGVGAFATQIVLADGGTVSAVASGAHEEFVRSLGASDFFDYHTTDYAKTNSSWDIIFDAAGKSSFQHARPVLKEQGHYVSTEPSVKGLLTSLLTWPMSKKGEVMLARSRAEDLEALVSLWSDGKMKIHVDEVFPFEKAAEAHRKLEQESFPGKLVLETGLA